MRNTLPAVVFTGLAAGALLILVIYLVSLNHWMVPAETIHLGDGMPWGIAANPRTGDMVVAEIAKHSIFIIDGKTNEIRKKLTLAERNETFSFSGPETVVYLSKSGNFYAIDAPSGKITEINGVDYEVMGTIDVGESMWWSAYDPEHQEVYVVSKTTHSVFVISEEMRQVIDKIPVGAQPWGIAYNPDDREIYLLKLGNSAGEQAGLQVIDTESHNVVETIPIEQGAPVFLAFDPNNQRIYVSCASGAVVVIDAKTRELIQSIPIPEIPQGYYVEQHTGEYVVYDNFTEVLNSGAEKLGSQPLEIIFVPDNGYMYDVNGGAGVLTVIDAGSMRIVDHIATLPAEYGIAYNSHNKSIYLSHENLGSISIIPVAQKR